MQIARSPLSLAALVWVSVAVGLRTTLLAPEVCPTLTATEAHSAAVAAADWIAGNLGPDGRFLYEYHRVAGRTTSDYNLVRHAGTTMALYQVAAADERRFVEPADDALTFMLDRLVDTGEGAAWATPGTSPKLGAAALLAVSLLERREVTGDSIHDDLLRGLGRFMVGQQRPDGSMLETWDRTTGSPVPEITSQYATGEALWALARLHRIFPNEGWDAPAWRTLDYLATRRDADEELFPRPWPDQWAAYSLEEMGDWGLSADHVTYARELAAQFGVQVRWDSQRHGVATVSHPPAPRGAGFGTVLEGAGMLQRLAAGDGRLEALAEPLAERLLCGAARLRSWQVASAEDVVGSQPEREMGAWFAGGVTRMDDQQHAASGLLWAETLLKDRER